MVKKEQEENIISQCVQDLKAGNLPPWKVESELESSYSIIPPDNFGMAARIRRNYIEEETGEKFTFIQISEKPYKIRYICREKNLIWELDARDKDHICSICGSELESLGQYDPLVFNYVGGREAYYSYAGKIKVKGDVENEFTNLLVYGTGLGPIGVTRGCHMINKFGGAEVKVSEFGRAVRCNGYIFKTEEMRKNAIEIVKKDLPMLKSEMGKKMKDFGGWISAVEFKEVEDKRDFILYVDFVASFTNFRGHGDISRAVGFVKGEIEARLQKAGIEYELSVIAQGYDGDLKPSPRNKRGRYASAEIRIPLKEFEESLGVKTQEFISFVKVDSIGSQKLGCQFYSGMGGEIIPAVYRATQVNPQSPLVSSFENIYAKVEKGDLVYGVELPNVEVGIASSREGLISPVGREALRIMGIKTAREFAASLAAQVLAGEFNLALEITRQKLYS